MDRKRYKTHPRRAAALATDEQWRADPLDGPDSLFFELEPYLYCADATLCQFARTIAFSEHDGGDSPPAVLFPPRDGIGWMQGLLSESFQVTVCTPTPEPLLEEVSQQFNTLAVFGAPPEYLLGNTILAIDGESAWPDEDHFVRRLWQAEELLHEDGAFACVVAGRIGENGSAFASWSKGGETPLGELLELEIGRDRLRLKSIELPFAHLLIHREDYLTAFLRRHRAYFGKGVRGACLARMTDVDFRDCLEGPGSQLRCAIVCTLNRESASDSQDSE